ncbi:hypothetical protein Gogos_015262 [Gossypium gossypioides]|uniref:Zinc knuckle CX2CX4HX4C domain-containing protein n=1 Tax=Gossypium gossypioides TaxID=34282 RepID=A0A7J9C143_GOSGO|nr:hypothetical protein [Gossypium gossypioides]
MSSASPSLSPLAMVEDKAIKKVRMRCGQSGIEEQVMVMEDTEAPKALEEKPNERLSFKDILVCSLKSLGKVVQRSEKNDLQLLESDVSIETEDGLLSIRFSKRVHQALHKSMARTIVVKLLGQKIGIQTLSNRIYCLWKLSTPRTVDHVWAIPNGSIMVTIFFYFLALFVKCGGLDSFFGYLGFHVPKEHFKKDRMTVILDINKPLISKIKVDGRIQWVEYESLPNVCFSCGCYEHLKDMCNAGLGQEEQNGEGVQFSVVIGESSSTNKDVESGNF